MEVSGGEGGGARKVVAEVDSTRLDAIYLWR